MVSPTTTALLACTGPPHGQTVAGHGLRLPTLPNWVAAVTRHDTDGE